MSLSPFAGLRRVELEAQQSLSLYFGLSCDTNLSNHRKPVDVRDIVSPFSKSEDLQNLFGVAQVKAATLSTTFLYCLAHASELTVELGYYLSDRIPVPGLARQIPRGNWFTSHRIDGEILIKVEFSISLDAQ